MSFEKISLPLITLFNLAKLIPFSFFCFILLQFQNFSHFQSMLNKRTPDEIDQLRNHPKVSFNTTIIFFKLFCYVLAYSLIKN